MVSVYNFGTIIYVKYFLPPKYVGRCSVEKPLKKDVNYLRSAKYIQIQSDDLLYVNCGW